MSIDPDDDLVLGRGDAEVQGRRRTRRWVVDYSDPRIRRCERLGDLVRSVAAGSDRNDHLELTRIVLIEHPTDRRLEVAFLVQHWHDDRDTGPGCADAISSGLALILSGLHPIILSVPIFEQLAHRAWNPPPSSSLAEERTSPFAPPPSGGARFPTLRTLSDQAEQTFPRSSVCASREGDVVGLGSGVALGVPAGVGSAA